MSFSLFITHQSLRRSTLKSQVNANEIRNILICFYITRRSNSCNVRILIFGPFYRDQIKSSRTHRVRLQKIKLISTLRLLDRFFISRVRARLIVVYSQPISVVEDERSFADLSISTKNSRLNQLGVSMHHPRTSANAPALYLDFANAQ